MSMKKSYLAREDSDSTTSSIWEWREFVAILLERAWIGIGVAVAVLLFFVVGLMRETPLYRSTAVLLVEAQIPPLLNHHDVMGYNLRNLEYFNTIINTLHSQQMMEKALQQSGLADRPDFLPELDSLQAKARAALHWARITTIETSRLIKVDIEHPDPEVASVLATAMAEAYIQQDLNDRMQASMQAMNWLQERSIEYRAKLETGLTKLQQYRETTGSVSLEDDQNIVIAKLKSLNHRLTEAEADRIEAEVRWAAIRRQVAQGVPLARLVAQLNNHEAAHVLRHLREQQLLVADLESRYLADHPDLAEATQRKAALAAEFEKSARAAIAAVQADYEILKAREAGLRQALHAQEQLAFELDRKMVHYDDLRRNVQADQSIYQSVLTRIKEANISGSLPSEIIRLVEKARPAEAPFHPQPRRVITRGALLGIVAGMLAIIVGYHFDHRFRRSHEVERVLGLPVIGTLPIIHGKDRHVRGLAAHLEKESEVAECFRTLRARLMMTPEGRDTQVLMISSSTKAEGKSLISSNLAVSYAQNGQRTLLIGTDLRKPTLSEIFFQEREQQGLADVLQGASGWEEVTRPTGIPNLDIIPAGQVHPHPHELLGNNRLAAVLQAIRPHYEHIIIDAPPILGVSDSLVLLPCADGVLFVVRYGVTHSASAEKSMEIIEKSGVPCLGAIMNGVNLNALANYYYYRHYEGYAYQNYQADVPSVSST